MLSDELVLKNLFRSLWDVYVERVSYARDYQRLVLAKGGQVHNDHIAFRTIDTEMDWYPGGIKGIRRVFKTFGYKVKGEYEFPDKYLQAIHLEHPNEDLPRIFISELKVNKLPTSIQNMINESVNTNVKDRLTLYNLTEDLLYPDKMDSVVNALFHFFHTYPIPWGTPKEDVIRAVNEHSQYAAWTLLHGNSVNHFTAYVNKQGVEEWPNIEATAQGLIDNGVPMKPEIEGAPGSKLRQTATQPIIEKVAVLDEEGNVKDIEWPYAYYEIAERGFEDGEFFTGFLGSQATHLFEMTKKS